jgi:hypothetical protein
MERFLKAMMMILFFTKRSMLKNLSKKEERSYKNHYVRGETQFLLKPIVYLT